MHVCVPCCGISVSVELDLVSRLFSLVSVCTCVGVCASLCIRTQAEMAHTCRGTISLTTAHIEVGDACHLVLTSGGRSYHLKATSDGESQRWVSALQQAKANASHMMHQSGERQWKIICLGGLGCF